MRFAFEYLSNPIKLSNECVNVLCIENKPLFRNVFASFINNDLENSNIVFSKDFTPISFKKYGCFIYDYYNLDLSSAFVKKIYDDISCFCNDELSEDVIKLRSAGEILLNRIVKEYDYDFEYSDDFSMQNFFKLYNLKPCLNSPSLLDSLLQYIILVKKYLNIGCFVLANLHLYFSFDELKEFYSCLVYNEITLLVLENDANFKKLNNENIFIIDDDLCEIVD